MRRHVDLAPAAPVEQVCAAISKRCPVQDLLDVVLLVRNLESLLQARGGCEPSVDADLLRRALAKDLGARDTVLVRAAWGDRSTRDCVRSGMPSFDGLVRLLAGLFRG